MRILDPFILEIARRLVDSIAELMPANRRWVKPAMWTGLLIVGLLIKWKWPS